MYSGAPLVMARACDAASSGRSSVCAVDGSLLAMVAPLLKGHYAGSDAENRRHEVPDSPRHHPSGRCRGIDHITIGERHVLLALGLRAQVDLHHVLITGGQDAAHADL